MTARHLAPLFVAALGAAVPAQQPPAPAGETAAEAAFAEVYSTARARALAAERRAAAEQLFAALDQGAGLEELAAAVEDAIRSLSASPDARTRLTAALQEARAGGGLSDLERAVERIGGDLRFRPYVEAELPLGWPDTAPVGEVVLKSYPRYRMARTGMASRGGMNTPFFALFNHIKRNDIAMTAPVQMDYDRGDSERRATSMAFLYSHPEQGDSGADGADARVEVVDVAPILAVSIGARGYETPQKAEALRGRLEAWLTANADDYEAAGPLRTMGYNSPMVPAARRFFEIEIPVRRKERKAD